MSLFHAGNAWETGNVHEYAVKLVPRGRKTVHKQESQKEIFWEIYGKLKVHTLPVTSRVFSPL